VKGCRDALMTAAALGGLSIVGGNLNAKSSIWGNSTHDNKGQVLEQILISAGFFCLNDGSPTYSPYPPYFSALDLTFVNKDREVFEGNLNWSTSNSKISNSNHFPII